MRFVAVVLAVIACTTATPSWAEDRPVGAAPSGGYFDYECHYDHGVTRPVRTDGFGNPMSLVFGTSAEDAMCIVTGTYYE